MLHHLLYESMWGVSPIGKPTWEIGTEVPPCHAVMILTSSTPWEDVCVCVCGWVYIHIYYIILYYIILYYIILYYITIFYGILLYYSYIVLNIYIYKHKYLYVSRGASYTYERTYHDASSVHLSYRLNPVHTSQVWTQVQYRFAFYLFNTPRTTQKQKHNCWWMC